ncbi:MAG: N-acetyltransferase [Hymenobacteraceae bacterium]|nr:N-acetyltransferase [Hymenobacteraceae bacterium]
MDVKHTATEQAFTVSVDGHDGELTYARPADGVVDFQHTWVDEALRGRHVGDALAEAALEFAKKEGLRIRTSCSFVAAYVKRHPEWEQLRDAA